MDPSSEEQSNTDRPVGTLTELSCNLCGVGTLWQDRWRPDGSEEPLHLSH